MYYYVAALGQRLKLEVRQIRLALSGISVCDPTRRWDGAVEPVPQLCGGEGGLASLAVKMVGWRCGTGSSVLRGGRVVWQVEW